MLKRFLTQVFGVRCLLLSLVMRAALQVPHRLIKVLHAADGCAVFFGYSSFSLASLWFAVAAMALQSTLTHANAAIRNVVPESQETQWSTTDLNVSS